MEGITSKGKAPAYRINHARILLKADINQSKGGLRDREISEALDISVSTIERVRQRFVEESLEVALSRRTPLKKRPRLLDGEKGASLIAIACAQAPEGRVAWTLTNDLMTQSIPSFVLMKLANSWLRKTKCPYRQNQDK